MGVDPIAILAFSSVFAYQLNGHVLKQIGKMKLLDPVTLVWMLHVVIVLLAPYAYKKRSVLVKELGQMQISAKTFVSAVVFNTFLQMGINYFWFLSAQAIPVQLTSAIYQTAIGFVYILSVLFLGEQFSFWKAVGVVMAVGGVFLSSYFPPGAPVAVNNASGTASVTDAQFKYAYGITCAFIALGSKVASQIFCKVMLNGGSSEFMLLYNIHMGFAHIYAFLPVMLVCDAYGIPNMSFRFELEWTAIAFVFVAACICSFVNFGYQCVPVVKSPLYLCRFQVLGVIIAVVLDFLFYGTSPQLLGYVGYSAILFAFLLVSGVVDPSGGRKQNEKVEGKAD